MADSDRTVSPYLLRPPRTLEQVLGGRSRASEFRPEVQQRQPRNGRDVPRETANKEPDSPTRY
jgi:hypothetical protein